MNQQLKLLTSLLVLAMATAFVGSAQEINATMDVTVNNTTSNSTIIDDAAIGADNAAAEGPAPESRNESAINLSLPKGSVQDLSTASSQSAAVAPISQMAGSAPLLAAGASSIQTADPVEGSYKMGTVVNDANQTRPNPTEFEPLSLGLPTKPIRDVGKIFFVCDLV